MAELYLVEFNGSRKEYFYNSYHHSLKLSEYVIIQAEQGEDMGLLTRRIDKEIDFSTIGRPRSILRPAGPEDRSRWEELRRNEVRYKQEIVKLIGKHGLSMKIVDAECQFDGSKITFYFTAEHRVDFRALVRDLASRYRTRIELRQIGVRDEARRVGGYGICGLRQCCSSHLHHFEPITTQQARDQDLALNPSKISGNCGRLLCCLKYEAEQYMEVKKRFPPVGTHVRTTRGKGVIDRIDIFKQEAVISGEDNLVFRVPAEEIMRYKTSSSNNAGRGDVQAASTGDE